MRGQLAVHEEWGFPPDEASGSAGNIKNYAQHLESIYLPLQDAVNLIAHSKTRSNPENNVALMTLSDLSVLVTLTSDTGKILAKLNQVSPAQDLKFISGLKIAHLCLKHRQGKNHKTRIIAFVG